MGYSIYQIQSSFVIRCANFLGALEAIKSLKGQETTGCTGDLHFMYVDNSYINCLTLEEILAKWRWQVEELNEAGDIISISFIGENYGDEDLLFSTLAPFVESNSFVSMVGEDGVVWRWFFNQHKFVKQYGRILFDNQAYSQAKSSGVLGKWPHLDCQ